MKSRETKHFAFMVILFYTFYCSSGCASLSTEAAVGNVAEVTSAPNNVPLAPELFASDAPEFKTEKPPDILRTEEEARKAPCSILFIFGSGFDYRHYAGTRRSLEQAGHQIQVASTSLNPIGGNYIRHDFENISASGKEVPVLTADLLLQDVQPADYCAIIFIDDNGLTLNPSPDIHKIILEAARNRVVLATQEYSIYLLAESKLLKGKKVTGNPLICQDMEATYSAICTLMPVQRDAGVVTSDPTAATASFARAILAEIEERDG